MNMANEILQYVLYLVILVVLAIPLGKYIGKIMNGEHVFLSKILVPCENFIYKILGIDKNEDMDWKKYAVCVAAMHLFGFIILWLILMFQDYLPWNPQGYDGLSWHLALNTAVSFVTNTNWQTYSGEYCLSTFSQAMGLTTQNFLSSAVAIAVLFAIIRGLVRAQANGLGNFWVDMTRIILYLLLPISLITSVVLISQGCPQTLDGFTYVDLLEPIAADADGNILEDAEIDLDTETVTVDGEVVEDAVIVTQQVLPLYAQGSQTAIKQLGTNGGGILGSNSCHPYENPNLITNLIEMLYMLLIPAALCFTFGRNVKDMRQGKAIFAAMFIMLIACTVVIGYSEMQATPALEADGLVDTSVGNLEGKETRFGMATSVTWAAWTASSAGAVIEMHDSLTPLSGMVALLEMMLDMVIFGAVGSGFYNMLAFVLFTVFIGGLMVGRTPEYLGKKIESHEMRLVMLVVLGSPFAILIASAIVCLNPSTVDQLANLGAHGLTEILYNCSSAGVNNGSAFAGMSCDTPFLNVTLTLEMLLARFLPMFCMLAIAGSLVQKKKYAQSSGTLSTCNGMFVFLLILVVIIVGALSYLPALSLGPIAEYTEMLGLGG